MAGGVGLSLRQLNCLAVMFILTARGMISLEDLAFVVFSIVYMHLLFKVAFPRNAPLKDCIVFDQRNKIFRSYMTFSAFIGLYFSVAYIIHGIRGVNQPSRARPRGEGSGPHLFLVTSQVFMEGVAFTDRYSIPVQVFVPVLYNSRRIFTLVEWVRSEFSKVDNEHASSNRVYVGRVLALANMGLWCFNLFGFLLPVYLPRAFKKYYTEIESKVRD
ncbi:uncharacterized protein LOC120191860 [Hibiscus syriacus]|uniref:uncharacterized protein LOC120191860 n=1 Tax=Hibiscus syriacus TaxID=106335 RepID=UPI0019242B48|nr:uncharacterized protein LOC120191860 [Hibiscus syriacus]